MEMETAAGSKIQNIKIFHTRESAAAAECAKCKDWGKIKTKKIN
jgi:hypothetical protein